MIREELVFVATCDISGLARGKGFPARELPARLKKGVGWTGSNLMMSPFGPIWDTPFGTAGRFDDRSRPRPRCGSISPTARRSSISSWATSAIPTAPMGVLSARFPAACRQGTTTRRACASSRHSSRNSSIPASPTGRATPMRSPPFAARAFRRDLHCRVARRRGGSGHVSRRVRPAPIRGDGHAAARADRRRPRGHHPRDGARRRDRLGQRVIFSPKPDPELVGNGVHIHMSLADSTGRPATHAPGEPMELASRRSISLPGCSTICRRSARSPRPRRSPICG